MMRTERAAAGAALAVAAGWVSPNAHYWPACDREARPPMCPGLDIEVAPADDGLNATPDTASLWPDSLHTAQPEATSHNAPPRRIQP